MRIPFSEEAFFQIFSKYNQAVFPIQIALIFAAAIMVFLIIRKSPVGQRFIPLCLGFFWAWMGIVYHLLFFSTINPIAKGFGVMFVFQAILFTIQGIRGKWVFDTRKASVFTWISYVLFTYALVGYPILGYLSGHQYPSMPTFGLPCPTTIFTIAVLLIVRKSIPSYMWITPIVWAGIGTSAALSLGVPEDYGLGVAGLFGIIGMVTSIRKLRK